MREELAPGVGLAGSDKLPFKDRSLDTLALLLLLDGIIESRLPSRLLGCIKVSHSRFLFF